MNSFTKKIETVKDALPAIKVALNFKDADELKKSAIEMLEIVLSNDSTPEEKELSLGVLTDILYEK